MVPKRSLQGALPQMDILLNAWIQASTVSLGSGETEKPGCARKSTADQTLRTVSAQCKNLVSSWYQSRYLLVGGRTGKRSGCRVGFCWSGSAGAVVLRGFQ